MCDNVNLCKTGLPTIVIMAEEGKKFNSLADESANVSAVLGTHRFFKILKGTVKRVNLHVWLNCL